VDNVLFIVPPPIRYVDFVEPDYNVGTVSKKNGTFASVLTEMPLGIMSMSSYLKKHTPVRTKLVDFNIILNKLERFEYGSFAELFRHHLSLLELEPAIIGISSLFTPSYRNILDIAEICRSLFPQALVVAGGGIPTNMYREIFETSGNFHALCFGEGEKPLLDLVQATDRLRQFADNPAWITRGKVEAGQTFRHDYIEDLDEIPFLDYDLLEDFEYGMNPLSKTYAGIDDKSSSFHVMTSRGCPHRCCFCASHTVHGRQMRYYSLERVKEDFTRLKDQYHAKTLIFQDDHLANIKKRTLRLLEIIKELQVTAIFQNGIALYTLERELLEAYKSVGVNQLVLAVESGSERVLKEIIHKPLNLGIVKRVADDCRDLDIYTDVNLLIGFPGETKQDIEDTCAFLKTINANWFRVVVATPLVGSEMFEICMKKGYLKHGYIDCNYKKAVVDTEEFTAEWIQERAYLLNLELNFVCNSDVKFGRYRIALKGFESAIKAKADHAIAFWCAAKCYKELGELDKARQYMQKAKTIIGEDPRWRRYAEMFNIQVEDS
jgi:radical SAM superfamily enzyme YgiQ (UPF0313 family)